MWFPDDSAIRGRTDLSWAAKAGMERARPMVRPRLVLPPVISRNLTSGGSSFLSGPSPRATHSSVRMPALAAAPAMRKALRTTPLTRRS